VQDPIAIRQRFRRGRSAIAFTLAELAHFAPVAFDRWSGPLQFSSTFSARPPTPSTRWPMWVGRVAACFAPRLPDEFEIAFEQREIGFAPDLLGATLGCVDLTYARYARRELPVG
jgi:hypothetical protein